MLRLHPFSEKSVNGYNVFKKDSQKDNYTLHYTKRYELETRPNNWNKETKNIIVLD